MATVVVVTESADTRGETVTFLWPDESLGPWRLNVGYTVPVDDVPYVSSLTIGPGRARGANRVDSDGLRPKLTSAVLRQLRFSDFRPASLRVFEREMQRAEETGHAFDPDDAFSFGWHVGRDQLILDELEGALSVLSGSPTEDEARSAISDAKILVDWVPDGVSLVESWRDSVASQVGEQAARLRASSERESAHHRRRQEFADLISDPGARRSKVDYLEVAAVYSDAWHDGMAPTRAVADVWVVAASTAGNYVSRARNDYGYLEPTEKRKPNGRLTEKAKRLLAEREESADDGER